MQTYYNSWIEISRGVMGDVPGPQVEEELRWDTAAVFSVNAETPWDVLHNCCGQYGVKEWNSLFMKNIFI